MKRLTYKQIADLTPEEIGSLSKKDMVSLLKQVRSKLDTRLESFGKQGKNFYSPAAEKMESYYADNPRATPSRISRNKAMNEIFKIQEFFQAKTSTVKGSRDVMREQDSKIFGVHPESGRPLHRMSREQRTKFWETYNEFLNQNKTAIAAFTSGKIQQYLGDMITSRKGKKLSKMETLEQLYDQLRADNEKMEGLDATRNILSGRRHTK